MTHFRGVSVTKNSLVVILSITLSIEIAQLTFACFIEKYDEKRMYCCWMDVVIEKQINSLMMEDIGKTLFRQIVLPFIV